MSEADLPDLLAMFTDDMQIISRNSNPKSLPGRIWMTGTIVFAQWKKKEVIPESQMGLGF